MKLLCQESITLGHMQTVAGSNHARFVVINNPNPEDIPLYTEKTCISVGRKNGTRRIYLEEEGEHIELLWHTYGSIPYLLKTNKESKGIIDIVSSIAIDVTGEEEEEAVREGVILVPKEDVKHIFPLAHGIVFKFEPIEDDKGKTHYQLHKCIQSIVAITGICRLKILLSNGNTMWQIYDENGEMYRNSFYSHSVVKEAEEAKHLKPPEENLLLHLHTLPIVTYKLWRNRNNIPA